MTRRRLDTKEYTVGWICALPIELAASQELLDEEHEKPNYQDSLDPNLYTLGRIGPHNVVLACLPAGSTGTQSAATVATQMRSKYTSIRFGLMVGIGGGVPSEDNDIRLGDVVISQPYLQHGGVVQYDFGKTQTGGVLQTGWLNAPPAALLHAITELRALHYRGRSNIGTNLAVFKGPGLGIFARERAGADVLYEATYAHVEGGATCERCSKEMQVKRPIRQEDQSVVIHYGTIASGNQVMKDGTKRDRISRDFGGVKCFEMEAAGLMNNFPCLVVRGICDYADSHKNKRWQPYAASTAAACAKELLAVIPTFMVRETALVVDETVQDRIEKRLDQLFQDFQERLKTPAFFGPTADRSALEKELVDGTVTEIDVEDNRPFIDDWLSNTQRRGFDSPGDARTFGSVVEEGVLESQILQQNQMVPLSDPQNEVIGSILSSNRLMCSDQSCGTTTFGDLAEFRRHYDQYHAKCPPGSLFSPRHQLEKLRDPNSVIIGCLTVPGDFWCGIKVWSCSDFTSLNELRQHFDTMHGEDNPVPKPSRIPCSYLRSFIHPYFIRVGFISRSGRYNCCYEGCGHIWYDFEIDLQYHFYHNHKPDHLFYTPSSRSR